MGLTTFLLRLIGRSPEQVQEQERFDSTIHEFEARDRQLDSLLLNIRDVDKTYRDKTVVHKKIAESVRPTEGPDDVRIELVSDPGNLPG